MANYAGAKVEVVLPNLFHQVGEGPHWDEATNCLLFVDIGTETNENRSALFRWHADTGKLDQVVFDHDTVSAILPRKSGGYVVPHNLKLVAFDWDSKEVTPLAEVTNRGKECRFNDAKCDPAGRVWAGTMSVEFENKKGILGCLDTDGSWHVKLEDIDLSNGMDWTADRKTMYYIDSWPRKVYAFDYDEKTGTIANKRVAIDFVQGDEKATSTKSFFPDGCCLDTDDNLWIACYNGSKVVHFNPKTGEKLGEISLPVECITSVCFGGSDYTDLYVTCAQNHALDADARTSTPEAGSLFKVTGLGVKGRPANVYHG